MGSAAQKAGRRTGHRLPARSGGAPRQGALGGHGVPHQDACLSHAQRPVLFSGPGPRNNGGCFVPSIGTPVFGVWKLGRVFPRGGLLSHEGVCFPMCRVRCFFFCRPGHMLAPSKEFLWGFVPQNPVPSCLLPPPPTSPPHGDPGSGVFMDSDPWEGTEEISRRPPPNSHSVPHTPSAPAKHVFLPWHTSDEACALGRIPCQGEGRRSVRPCAAGNLFSHGSRTHLSEWKHVLTCGCVFSHADGPFPASNPRGPGPEA